jgi:hypothetical protein
MRENSPQCSTAQVDDKRKKLPQVFHHVRTTETDIWFGHLVRVQIDLLAVKAYNSWYPGSKIKRKAKKKME